jgi:hypothetical protein
VSCCPGQSYENADKAYFSFLVANFIEGLAASLDPHKTIKLVPDQ